MCAEVGLNMICHLKQGLDQFAPDVSEHFDLLDPGASRPVLSAFDWFAFSLLLCEQ